MALELPDLCSARCDLLTVELSVRLGDKLPKRLDRLLTKKHLSLGLRKAGFREFYTTYKKGDIKHMFAGLLRIVEKQGAYFVSAVILCRQDSGGNGKRVSVRDAQELLERLLLDSKGRKRAARVRATFSFPTADYRSAVLPVRPSGGQEPTLYMVGLRAPYSKTRYNTLEISLSEDEKSLSLTSTFFLKVKKPSAILTDSLTEAKASVSNVIEET